MAVAAARFLLPGFASVRCLFPIFSQVRINYANPDMVGHTGDLEASKHACAFVDACVKELLTVCDEVNGRWVAMSTVCTTAVSSDLDNGGHKESIL
jgi:2,3-bisphosphoglycerate-independent phosphoglycerate mutase